MNKNKKSTTDFKIYSLKSKMNKIFGGGAGDPTEGDGKKTPPPPPPPPTGPLGPIIIK